MSSRKSSPIWQIPENELRAATATSTTITGILRVFGFASAGQKHRILLTRLRSLAIDFSHIPLGRHAGLGRSFGGGVQKPLSEILVEHSTFHRQHLKKKLIKEGLLPERCVLCDQGPVWCGQPLVLTLDHINGTNDDNRFWNLRLLCPNCHSQTSTFCGKNTNKVRRPKAKCMRCGRDLFFKNDKMRCRDCYCLESRKVERPSLEILLDQVAQSSYVAVGKFYGVSNNTVRKWIKRGMVVQEPPQLSLVV